MTGSFTASRASALIGTTRTFGTRQERAGTPFTFFSSAIVTRNFFASRPNVSPCLG